MLSRFGLSALKQAKPVRSLLIAPIRTSASNASSAEKLCMKVAVTTPAASRSIGYVAAGERTPWDGPERDVQNFPRVQQAIEPGKVRYMFVPEEWFQFFYKKTGVTGPYVLTFGLWAYVMSKEIWLIEHEYYYVYALGAIVYILNKNFGKIVSTYLDKEIDAEETMFKQKREDQLTGFKQNIENEKTLQWQKEADKFIIEAKRENVAIQQEAIFRERAMLVYNEIKRRLEFQAQKQLMERRISQKHMVDWILNNVLKAITPQQEAETLKKCLVDLQSLAARS